MKQALSNIKLKTMLQVCLSFLILSIPLKGQDKDLPVRDYWSYNTAYLMPRHKWESGIAQPFRYGISEKFEIRSNALEVFVFPNAGLKIAQGSRNGLVFASDHIISYPTVFMNTVSMKGTGGLISPQYNIPSIWSFYNSLIATKRMGQTSLLTGFIGFSFAVRSSKLDPMATIDLALIYPRMAHYYEGSTFRLGINYKGSLSKKLFFEDGIETFIITRPTNNLFFENTGAIMWVVGKSVRIKGGYSLSYGKYPYGTMWQLWPSLDFVFGSKI